MARYLVFELDGTRARARLRDEAAPVTCETLWRLLPLAGPAEHAMLSGTNVTLYVDPAIVVPEESATIQIQTGDVMFSHYRAAERHGFPEALSGIHWAYDRYCRPTSPGRMTAVIPNVFAEFLPEAQPFFEACRRLRREGAKPVTITGATG